MSDAYSIHVGWVKEHINRLRERNECLRAAIAKVAAALGYGEGEAPRPDELAGMVSELRDTVERQAATLRRRCGTTHRYPTEGELSPNMRARLMPEGMEWPRFDDGEPVKMGDEVASHDDGGSPRRVGIVRFAGSAVRLYDSFGHRVWDESSEGPIRRPAPAAADSPGTEDSWERLEKDLEGGACTYFGSHERCVHCPANDSTDACRVLMSRDAVRRALALAGEVDE